jgi:predicted transposase YbfD/YdcC
MLTEVVRLFVTPVRFVKVGVLNTALSPQRFAAVVRAHWGIENSVHWVLDVTMNEDQNRNRNDNALQNLALPHH